MRKYVVWILCALLILSTVSALYGINYDAYSGQAGRERRATFDPYSRERYFGEGHVSTFGGFGSKGPVTGTIVGTGSKSAYSGVFNLDTNEFWSGDRRPSKTAKYDPNMRGFARMDVPVTLTPPGYADMVKNYPTGYTTLHIPQGTARVLSLSNVFKSAFKDRAQSAVYLQLRGIPPTAYDFRYKAWLYDEDADYWQSMGTIPFRGGIQSTASLDWEINRPVWMYDYVYVTKEPFPDEDPRPSDDVILMGEIDTPRSATYTQGYLAEVTVR